MATEVASEFTFSSDMTMEVIHGLSVCSKHSVCSEAITENAHEPPVCPEAITEIAHESFVSPKTTTEVAAELSISTELSVGPVAITEIVPEHSVTAVVTALSRSVWKHYTLSHTHSHTDNDYISKKPHTCH